MHWVYAVPLWVAGVSIIGGACMCAALGLYIHARYARRVSDEAHNDVAGPLIGIAGTILAVTMSMMLVGVWQEYDAAASHVADESSALTDLVRLARTTDTPDARALTSLILAYTDAIVTDEWPLMRRGGSSTRVAQLSEEVLRAVSRGPQRYGSFEVDLMHTALDARRARLQANGQSIPAMLWWVMLFVGAVTIYLSFLFGVKRRGAHVLMIFALSAIIGSVYFAIAELDLPFEGPCAITPDAFDYVYNAAKL